METLDESTHDKLTSRLTKVASISLGDGDTIWAIRHYTGSGVYTKLIEVHVIRNQKFLGRFEVQEVATHEAAWQPTTEHPRPASNSDLVLFKKARMLLLGMVDKLWL